MPHSHPWTLLIALGLLAASCAACTSSERSASPSSTWNRAQSLMLPPNAEPNSFIRGSVLDPSVSGTTPIYYQTIDEHGYHSLFQDKTDSEKHFTAAIPMGIKEIDVGREIDAKTKQLLRPARCLIGVNLSIRGVGKLENVPAEGPAILGGVSAIEPGAPTVLQTRAIDVRALSAEVDGSTHGVEILAASSTSAVLSVYDAAPGTHELILLSNGKETNPMRFQLKAPPAPTPTSVLTSKPG